MHISEGVLKPEILIPAAAISGACVAWLLWRLRVEHIAQLACLSALFFVASFIHVPIGPTSIHLVLSGFIGAFLGADAMLAIFIGLAFQGLFFGYGGVSVLGVNLLVISLPAILGRYFLLLSRRKWQELCLFMVGFAPILLSSLLLSLVLVLNGKEFVAVAGLTFASNLALMVIEGIISLFALKFIQRVKPELLR